MHAIIYSEDAPTLEKELHRRFERASKQSKSQKRVCELLAPKGIELPR
ncbi:hypothetical protein [Pseudoalteromonas lipolytica]